MSAGPPRVLIAHGAPAIRAQLEAPLRQAGWNAVTVGSTSEVLRAVRDHDVSVVLIDPELPGPGVSGVDVVRTLKSAPRFRQVPVFFLLHDGRRAPDGVAAEGALELDRLTSAALLEMIRHSLGIPPELGHAGESATREPMERDAETVARFCQDDVERILREVAHELVPGIAERLIREEIQRLRREHGFEDPPR